jgi:hypothetical protein
MKFRPGVWHKKEIADLTEQLVKITHALKTIK